MKRDLSSYKVEIPKEFYFGGKRDHVMERDCESFIYLPKKINIERKW